jgi:zinc-finger-containing domain
MAINCPYCGNAAELVTGAEIYPHRQDLASLKFWRCSPCDAHVGCHKRNKKYGNDGTVPLGRLANADLRRAKSRVHAIFDPIWKNGRMERREAYLWLAGRLNIPFEECHIGMFDLPTCDRAVNAVKKSEFA